MASIFTKIINGEIPCHKVAESNEYLAFLDINPMMKGHTLVIPKKEVDYIFDVDDDTLAGLMVFAKKVAKALDATIPCKRVGVMVIGTEVPHAHVHLLPFQQESAFNITAPRVKIDHPELAEIAATIREKF